MCETTQLCLEMHQQGRRPLTTLWTCKWTHWHIAAVVIFVSSGLLQLQIFRVTDVEKEEVKESRWNLHHSLPAANTDDRERNVSNGNILLPQTGKKRSLCLPADTTGAAQHKKRKRKLTCVFTPCEVPVIKHWRQLFHLFYSVLFYFYTILFDFLFGSIFYSILFFYSILVLFYSHSISIQFFIPFYFYSIFYSILFFFFLSFSLSQFGFWLWNVVRLFFVFLNFKRAETDLPASRRLVCAACFKTEVTVFFCHRFKMAQGCLKCLKITMCAVNFLCFVRISFQNHGTVRVNLEMRGW